MGVWHGVVLCVVLPPVHRALHEVCRHCGAQRSREHGGLETYSASHQGSLEKGIAIIPVVNNYCKG